MSQQPLVHPSPHPSQMDVQILITPNTNPHCDHLALCPDAMSKAKLLNKKFPVGPAGPVPKYQSSLQSPGIMPCWST